MALFSCSAQDQLAIRYGYSEAPDPASATVLLLATSCHIPVPSALMVSHMVSLVIPIDKAEGIISGNQ